MAQFPTNKGRIDSAFYADLQRACDTYNVWIRPACDSLAWTYYNAVKVFGNTAVLSKADIERRSIDSSRDGAVDAPALHGAQPHVQAGDQGRVSPE